MNRDIRWYIGFIAGASAAGLVLKYGGFQVHPIVRLILVIGIGAGCGWLVELLTKRRG